MHTHRTARTYTAYVRKYCTGWSLGATQAVNTCIFIAYGHVPQVLISGWFPPLLEDECTKKQRKG